MVGQTSRLDPESLEPDEPLLQDLPRHVGQAEDLESQRGTHEAFWDAAKGSRSVAEP